MFNLILLVVNVIDITAVIPETVFRFYQFGISPCIRRVVESRALETTILPPFDNFIIINTVGCLKQSGKLKIRCL